MQLNNNIIQSSLRIAFAYPINACVNMLGEKACIIFFPDIKPGQSSISRSNPLIAFRFLHEFGFYNLAYHRFYYFG
jgi:hypothetical protein